MKEQKTSDELFDFAVSEESVTLDRTAVNDDVAEEESVSEFYYLWFIFKKITFLSIPRALSYTFSIEVILVILFLNLLNSDEDNLAATAIISILMQVFMLLGQSPLFAINSIVSESLGAINEANHDDIREEEQNKIANIYRSGAYIATMTFPVVASSFVFSKDLLTYIFRQEEKIAELAQVFLRPYALAVPAVFYRMCAEQVMFSFKHEKAAMFFGLSTLGIGTLFSGIFGFGLFGAPKWGAAGIAMGYTIESYLIALLFNLYIAHQRDFKDIHFFNSLKIKVKELIEILKLGSSIAFAFSIEISLPLATAMFAGWLGTLEQSAWNFVMQLAFFTSIPAFAFGQQCCQEISRAIGNKDYEEANRIAKYGLLTTLAFTAPVPILLAIKPDLIMFTLKDSQEEMVTILNKLIPIIAAGVIGDSIRYNILQALRPLGSVYLSSIISVTGLSLGIASAAALGFKTDLGICGIGIGYSGGIILAGVGLLPFWIKHIQPAAIRAFKENKIANNTCCFWWGSDGNNERNQLLPVAQRRRHEQEIKV